MRVAALALVLALALPGAAAAANGKDLYGRFCAKCHAPDGTGIDPLGPPLTDSGARAAHFYLTTGYMPLKRPGIQPRRTRQVLGPADVRALIGYVASLGDGPPVPTPHPERGSLSEGQHLFAGKCAGCHQIAAEGGYVTGAVAPALEDATPVQIAEAVRIGPYVMPNFSETAVTDGQLNSIVRYVRWARTPDDRGGASLGHVGPVPEGLVTWFFAAALLVAVCMVLGRRLRRG